MATVRTLVRVSCCSHRLHSSFGSQPGNPTLLLRAPGKAAQNGRDDGISDSSPLVAHSAGIGFVACVGGKLAHLYAQASCGLFGVGGGLVKWRVIIGLLGILLFVQVSAVAEESTEAKVDRHLAEMVELYRWFHAHPELSRKEKETSKRLASELKKIGLEVTEGVGGYGVLGLLRGQQGGPLILYRADMDALPILEKTGLTYASKNTGVMHGCGHDIHMTCAVSALKVMAETKSQWRGTILFVGQPAEEVGSGAEAIIADSKFQALLKELGQPKLALALHDNASLPAGTVSVLSGFVSAYVDSVDITVFGTGGHGAYPHKTVDPIVIGAEIVGALQTIVSRRLAPGSKAVVTVGTFHAGTKRNIIGPTAKLGLTVRSYKDDIRESLIREIEVVAKGVAAAHGAPKPPKVYHHRKAATPSGFNNPEIASRLRAVFADELGEDAIRSTDPAMGGEDFSEYSRRLGIPSVMFSLGAADPEKVRQGLELPGLHSDSFAPAADLTISTGARCVVRALREALE